MGEGGEMLRQLSSSVIWEGTETGPQQGDMLCLPALSTVSLGGAALGGEWLGNSIHRKLRECQQ